MSILSTLWGLRLTYNFYIKGGYSGGEDYRWVQVRKWFPGLQFEVFNLLFICSYQLLLLLAIAAPAAVASHPSHARRPLVPLDYIAGTMMFGLIVCEAIADHQQFVFQKEKYRRIAEKLPAGGYSKGFIDTGLWAHSRHPNYFCEVHIWQCFYLFSVSASGEWLNWSIVGAIFLFLLFVPPKASLEVTEALSSRKYAEYADYQKRVSRFYPWYIIDGVVRTVILVVLFVYMISHLPDTLK